MRKAKYILFFVIILALAGGFFYRGKISGNKKIALKPIENPGNVEPSNNSPIVIESSPAQPVKTTAFDVPASVLLDVPFTSQAPFAVWDKLHEDACEEASLIMVKYFSDGTKEISKNTAEKEIQDMVTFEKKNKYGPSITLGELNTIAQEYYGMKTGRVKKNITAEDIKKELADGKPVIVGAAGKVLPNPNFKNGGPNYHMLVIIGYDAQGFITNDPGTRKGENFRYTFDGLSNAIHDWNAKNILNGGKDYLVFD